MKQIAIIGMSSFGRHLALKLAEFGCEVLAIDCDEAQIDEIKAYISQAIVADVMDLRVLQDLNLKEMDVVVLSLGKQFEATILAALHLKDLHAKYIVVKVISEKHARVLEKIGVDRIVFPERDMALRLASSLQGTNIADYVPLGSGYSIVEMQPLEAMIGKSLVELNFRKNYNCQVLAIKKTEPKERMIMPQPHMKILAKHRLVVMGKDHDLLLLENG